MEPDVLEGAVQGSQKLLLDIGHGIDEALRYPSTGEIGMGGGMGMATMEATAAKQIGPIASKLTGYTRHGLNQVISRDGAGVSAKAILNALGNPIAVIKQAAGKILYQGKSATVVLTKDGALVTAHANSGEGVRKLPKKDQ